MDTVPCLRQRSNPRCTQQQWRIAILVVAVNRRSYRYDRYEGVLFNVDEEAAWALCETGDAAAEPHPTM